MTPLNKQKKDGASGPKPWLGPPASSNGDKGMALLALSHSQIEHQLYKAMSAEVAAAGTRIGLFSTRRLMLMAGLTGYSAVRRGLAGLQSKLSIERCSVAGDSDLPQRGTFYYVFTPDEIVMRRRAAGLNAYPKEIQRYEGNPAFSNVIERITERYNLTRREAQVALCCTEGLTNAEIGERLHVSYETVKCHLRGIFIKCGVKRRAELVSHLLMQDAST